MTEPDLDHLYWHTDLPVATIATTTGVPAAGIHRVVTPLDAGLPCYRCGTAVTYASRAARAAARPRCPACGCSRRDPARERPHGAGLRLVPTTLGGVVVVLDDGCDLGHRIESCAHALAAAGVSWTGELARITDPASAGSAVVRALGACGEPTVVAVPSIAALGCSQAERLQVLFTLTRMRWRVVSAWDTYVARPQRPITAYDLDHLDDLDGPSDAYELGLAAELLVASAGDATPFGWARRAARFGGGEW